MVKEKVKITKQGHCHVTDSMSCNQSNHYARFYAAATVLFEHANKSLYGQERLGVQRAIQAGF